MILTRAEVAELTGYVRFRAQVRALDCMRIGYRLRPDGSPVVLRSAVFESSPPDPADDFEWEDPSVYPRGWWEENWRRLIVPRAQIIREAGDVRPPDGYRECIYVLLLGDEIRYVGRTRQFDWRIAKHRESKVFDRVWVLPGFHPYHVREVESLYMVGLEPPDNVAMGHGTGLLAPAAEIQRLFAGGAYVA